MSDAKTIRDIDDLQPDPENANLGTERGLRMLDDSLREDGAGRSILVDKDGVTIAGAKTLERAVDIGLPIRVVQTDGNELVVVQRTDLDLDGEGDEQVRARRMAYRDNRVSEVSYNLDVDRLLADIAAGFDPSPIFRDDEIEELLAEVRAGEAPEDPGAQVSRADELQEVWQTALGQVWELGDHRLAVGDCTDAAVVESVMRGEKADLVWTDPPFNVSYQANESIESLKARHRRTDGLVLECDSMSDAQFDIFLDAVLVCLPLKQGGAFYLCAPPGRTEGQFRNALNRAKKLSLRQCIVWVKNRFVFGRQDYHWRHESILYGWAEGASHYFVNDRTQDSVWEIDRPGQSPDHPTTKPVELAERAIRNSSKGNEIVFDGFVGSGTCIIACQRLHRKCRAIELDPGYAAVCLDRWATMTNGEPRLLA